MNKNLISEKNRLSLLIVVMLLLMIPFSGCIGNEEQDNELVIITYDVLALTDDMIQQFENETGLSVTLVKLDDAGSILDYLIQNEGKVVSRDEILDKVWGMETYPTTRTIDNYILSFTI